MPVIRFNPPEELNESYFFDDFAGAAYDNKAWAVLGGSGSAAMPASNIGGQIQVTANSNNYYELNMIANFSFSLQNNIIITWRGSLTSLTNCKGYWGANNSSNDYIALAYDSALSSNWLLQTKGNSVLTSTDTTIAADTSWHEFKIIGSSTLVNLFIDNVPIITNITNLTTKVIAPFCRSTSTTMSTKSILSDWIEVIGDRE